MKIYTITLHFSQSKTTMPYYFTKYKEAVQYGEFAFREHYDMNYYTIEKCFKPYPFYKLE